MNIIITAVMAFFALAAVFVLVFAAFYVLAVATGMFLDLMDSVMGDEDEDEPWKAA